MQNTEINKCTENNKTQIQSKEGVQILIKEQLIKQMLVTNIRNILIDYGYNFLKFDPVILHKLVRSQYNDDEAMRTIQFLNDNRIAIITDTGDEKIGLIFSPDDKTAYLLHISNHEIIDKYVHTVSFRSKKRCEICNEKNKKTF